LKKSGHHWCLGSWAALGLWLLVKNGNRLLVFVDIQHGKPIAGVKKRAGTFPNSRSFPGGDRAGSRLQFHFGDSLGAMISILHVFIVLLARRIVLTFSNRGLTRLFGKGQWESVGRC